MEWRPRNFFCRILRHRRNVNNNISVSGNNGKGTSVRVSVTDVRNDWIVPNTGYKQQTFSISLSQEINKYIKLDAKVNYYRKDSDNLPMTGYGTARRSCIRCCGIRPTSMPSGSRRTTRSGFAKAAT